MRFLQLFILASLVWPGFSQIIIYLDACPAMELSFIVDLSDNARLASTNLVNFDILEDQLRKIFNDPVLYNSANISVEAFGYNDNPYEIIPYWSSLSNASSYLSILRRIPIFNTSTTLNGLGKMTVGPRYNDSIIFLVTSQGSNGSLLTLTAIEYAKILKNRGWNIRVIALKSVNDFNILELQGIDANYVTVSTLPKSYLGLADAVIGIVEQRCLKYVSTTTTTLSSTASLTTTTLSSTEPITTTTPSTSESSPATELPATTTISTPTPPTTTTLTSQSTTTTITSTPESTTTTSTTLPATTTTTSTPSPSLTTTISTSSSPIITTISVPSPTTSITTTTPSPTTTTAPPTTTTLTPSSTTTTATTTTTTLTPSSTTTTAPTTTTTLTPSPTTTTAPTTTTTFTPSSTTTTATTTTTTLTPSSTTTTAPTTTTTLTPSPTTTTAPTTTTTFTPSSTTTTAPTTTTTSTQSTTTTTTTLTPKSISTTSPTSTTTSAPTTTPTPTTTPSTSTMSLSTTTQISTIQLTTATPTNATSISTATLTTTPPTTTTLPSTAPTTTPTPSTTTSISTTTPRTSTSLPTTTASPTTTAPITATTTQSSTTLLSTTTAPSSTTMLSTSTALVSTTTSPTTNTTSAITTPNTAASITTPLPTTTTSSASQSPSTSTTLSIPTTTFSTRILTTSWSPPNETQSTTSAPVGTPTYKECGKMQLLFLLDMSQVAYVSATSRSDRTLDILENQLKLIFIYLSLYPRVQIRVEAIGYSANRSIHILPHWTEPSKASKKLWKLKQFPNTDAWSSSAFTNIQSRPKYVNNILFYVTSQTTNNDANRNQTLEDVIRVKAMGWNVRVFALKTSSSVIDLNELADIDKSFITLSDEPKRYTGLSREVTKILNSECKEFNSETLPACKTKGGKSRAHQDYRYR